jgi:Mobilization protein NikA
MPEQAEKREKNLRRLRGRVARSRSIGTKVTPDEERQILAAAEAAGKVPSEWVRNLLLRGAVTGTRGEMEMHLFTELVGIQMLLMNALEPLFRDKMAQEQLTALYRRIQTTKAAQAQELLAKRNLTKEK